MGFYPGFAAAKPSDQHARKYCDLACEYKLPRAKSTTVFKTDRLPDLAVAAHLIHVLPAPFYSHNIFVL